MGTAWKDKLHDALWVYRTTYKTPIGMSLYQLVYGKTSHWEAARIQSSLGYQKMKHGLGSSWRQEEDATL